MFVCIEPSITIIIINILCTDKIGKHSVFVCIEPSITIIIINICVQIKSGNILCLYVESLQ